jgi:hypothetical protein
MVVLGMAAPISVSPAAPFSRRSAAHSRPIASESPIGFSRGHADPTHPRGSNLNKLRSKLAARACAAATCVRLGRKPTLRHHQQQEAIKRLKAGKETHGEIALP